MNVSSSIAELQREHVSFELECIGRMYLNAYVPRLTTEGGIAWYFRGHPGSSLRLDEGSGSHDRALRRADRTFPNGTGPRPRSFPERPAQGRCLQGPAQEIPRGRGVVFIGVAQEKARVPRTIRRRFEGGTIPWIDYTTAMVNFYYFYSVDEDFGPFFIKFCSYFPYTAKLCLNGHEYLKCQLRKKGIVFEALDNGLLSCADLAAAQRICDGLSAEKIESFFRKWLRKLPHPFKPKDRAAGYRYDLSILQAEFSLTQVWDRGTSGRCFFEEVIRENIDLGRPDQVQLIFQRRMQKKTATDGRCRTRIITEGVTPSLHVYYKNTHLKQYHKEGRALRTETTINNTYDFGVGRRIKNLLELRKIGFAANRRVLEVEKLSHDCQIGSAAFEKLQQPATVDGQHASALRFGDARVQALLCVLVMFCLQPQGFRNKQLRPLLAQCLGWQEDQITPGRMSYDLRRLRLHGLIERIAGSQRYRLTSQGLKTALFYSRTYARIIRPGLSLLHPQGATSLRAGFDRFEAELAIYFDQRNAA